MRISTFRGLATGSLLGLAIGAGMMLMPQGKRMKRMLDKGGVALKKQMQGMYGR